MTQYACFLFSFPGRALLAFLFALAGPGKVVSSSVGAFKVLAGVALLVGFFTRRAALALAAFTVAASLAFHGYWSMPEDQRFVQGLPFNNNLAIVGGLLILAASGPGAWSWERRRAAAPPARSTMPID